MNEALLSPQGSVGAPTALSRGLFTQIATALRENVGVDLNSCRHDLALLALGRRLRARQQESLKTYAGLIAADPVEPRRLARALLPSDGDYFLEGDAAAVVSLRLTTTLAVGEAPQVWVVECGEGEEVYALAMRLQQLLQGPEGQQPFTVHGSESDAGALPLARSGRLSPGFVRQIPEPLRQAHTHALSHGAMIQPALMRHCRFHESVLLAPPPVPALDVISGRNLLRYLDANERRLLLSHWAGALKPGGLLLLGPGESPQGHEDLFSPQPLASGVFLRHSTSTPAVAVEVPFTTPPMPAREVDVNVYRTAFASSLRPSALVDAQGHLLDFNLAFARLMQADTRPLIGQALQQYCAAEHREAISSALAQQPNSPQRPDVLCFDTTVLRPGGSRPMRLHLHLHAGQAIRAHVELESPDAPPVVSGSSLGLQAAMDLMSEGLMLGDAAGRILEINTVAQRLTGCVRREALGAPINDVLRVISPMGEWLLSPVDDCLRNGVSTALTGQQAQLVCRDGRRLAIELRVSAVRLADGQTGVALLFADVSQKLLVAEELSWRSTHDPVTGLLNRDEFELRVRSALTRARTTGEAAVLCMIDIDQFRLVNDVLGHSAGDEMLHELAGEMRVRLREGDVLARLSGDEFGVLLPGCRLREAEAIVQELLLAARRYRFQWLDRNHAVTLSIGVAQIDEATDNVGRALSLADAACHSAKEGGRDRARFMGRDDEAALHHSQMGVVGQVGRAIEDGRLFLLCEDVVSVSEPGQVVYRELLVRMRGEDGGLIKPAHFVPAAERYFLMSALDRWVAREALSKLALLPAGAQRGVLYAINISGQSISDPEFLDFMTSEIQRTGVDPTRLVFELTETTAISRLTDASRFVARLTERGCRFALDDFGVGMSSFSYLKNFPVHFLKIDGSFVRSMRDSHIDRGMVETINRIGHQLGLKTIAEHVESLDLLEPLKAMGVDWAQGHGIAPGRLLDDILLT